MNMELDMNDRGYWVGKVLGDNVLCLVVTEKQVES